jgi:hypothetical protein
MKKETKKRIITLFILFMFLGSSLAFAVISAIPTDNPNAAKWKAQIVIGINGEQYPIQSDIGIVNNETTGKVFTGNTDGVIYKSVDGDVTLKDFFVVWNKNFNSTCILDNCNTNTSSVVMFVNGKRSSDYELYKIQNNDVIIIDYR